MKSQYRESVKALADALGMSDIELADHYNHTFGESLPGSIYRHLTADRASKLLGSLALEAETREQQRNTSRGR